MQTQVALPSSASLERVETTYATYNLLGVTYTDYGYLSLEVNNDQSSVRLQSHKMFVTDPLTDEKKEIQNLQPLSFSSDLTSLLTKQARSTYFSKRPIIKLLMEPLWCYKEEITLDEFVVECEDQAKECERHCVCCKTADGEKESVHTVLSQYAEGYHYQNVARKMEDVLRHLVGVTIKLILCDTDFIQNVILSNNNVTDNLNSLHTNIKKTESELRADAAYVIIVQSVLNKIVIAGDMSVVSKHVVGTYLKSDGPSLEPIFIPLIRQPDEKIFSRALCENQRRAISMLMYAVIQSSKGCVSRTRRQIAIQAFVYGTNIRLDKNNDRSGPMYIEMNAKTGNVDRYVDYLYKIYNSANALHIFKNLIPKIVNEVEFHVNPMQRGFLFTADPGLGKTTFIIAFFLLYTHYNLAHRFPFRKLSQIEEIIPLYRELLKIFYDNHKDKYEELTKLCVDGKKNTVEKNKSASSSSSSAQNVSIINKNNNNNNNSSSLSTLSKVPMVESKNESVDNVMNTEEFITKINESGATKENVESLIKEGFKSLCWVDKDLLDHVNPVEHMYASPAMLVIGPSTIIGAAGWRAEVAQFGIDTSRVLVIPDFNTLKSVPFKHYIDGTYDIVIVSSNLFNSDAYMRYSTIGRPFSYRHELRQKSQSTTESKKRKSFSSSSSNTAIDFMPTAICDAAFWKDAPIPLFIRNILECPEYSHAMCAFFATNTRREESINRLLQQHSLETLHPGFLFSHNNSFLFHMINWRMCVIDEIHLLKENKVDLHIRNIQAQYKIGLTATPNFNNVLRYAMLLNMGFYHYGIMMPQYSILGDRKMITEIIRQWFMQFGTRSISGTYTRDDTPKDLFRRRFADHQNQSSSSVSANENVNNNSNNQEQRSKMVKTEIVKVPLHQHLIPIRLLPEEKALYYSVRSITRDERMLVRFCCSHDVSTNAVSYVRNYADTKSLLNDLRTATVNSSSSSSSSNMLMNVAQSAASVKQSIQHTLDEYYATAHRHDNNVHNALVDFAEKLKSIRQLIYEYDQELVNTEVWQQIQSNDFSITRCEEASNYLYEHLENRKLKIANVTSNNNTEELGSLHTLDLNTIVEVDRSWPAMNYDLETLLLNWCHLKHNDSNNRNINYSYQKLRKLYGKHKTQQFLTLQYQKAHVHLRDVPLTAPVVALSVEQRRLTELEIDPIDQVRFECIFEIQELENECERLLIVAQSEMRKSQVQRSAAIFLKTSVDALQGNVQGTCVTCMEELSEARYLAITQCGHICCAECMRDFIRAMTTNGRSSRITCMQCRASLSAAGSIMYVDTQSVEKQEEEIKKDNNNSNSSSPLSASHSLGANKEKIDESRKNQLRQTYGSKIYYIVNLINDIQTGKYGHPGKIIVSLEEEGLSREIYKALQEYKIGCCIIDGTARKIDTTLTMFLSDDAYKVILFASRKSRHNSIAGVNLQSVANHLIFAHPLLNNGTRDSSFTQTINRLTRPGQMHECHVYHPYVVDSIEQALLMQQRQIITESATSVHGAFPVQGERENVEDMQIDEVASSNPNSIITNNSSNSSNNNNNNDTQ